jgi:hypothetical protein
LQRIGEHLGNLPIVIGSQAIGSNLPKLLDRALGHQAAEHRAAAASE